jgi:hypothetical protein
MALYAISDLHLSFFKDKPMDKFGDLWKNHPKKIKSNWTNKITKDDTILIGGDISWAMNMEQFAPDFEFIKALDGRKIIGRGNHDYWWASSSNMSDMDKNTEFIKNGYAVYEDMYICMTRGWICPNDSLFTPHDEKIYNREVNRLERIIVDAKRNNAKRLLVLMHYPPTNDKKENSGFTELFKKYCVETVVYGHLHGKRCFDLSLKGSVDGINYYFTSADYLNFIPKRIQV